MKYIILLAALSISLQSCFDSDSTKLPIIGHSIITDTDTVYHEIQDFRLLNQDSVWITNTTFSDKIYVADFFLTSCPTICPKVKQQMLRITEEFEGEERLAFLGHSIDYKRDRVPRLREYATKLELDHRWHLVEVPEDDLEGLTANYLSVAYADDDAPGGFDHTGNILLIDQDRHIRSFAMGTDADKVSELIKDIKKLLNEMDSRH